MPPVGPADLPILPPPPPPYPYGPPDLTPEKPAKQGKEEVETSKSESAPVHKAISESSEKGSQEQGQEVSKQSTDSGDSTLPAFHSVKNRRLKHLKLKKAAKKIQKVTEKLTHILHKGKHHKHTKRGKHHKKGHHHHKAASASSDSVSATAHDLSPTVYELVTRLEEKFKKELKQLESEETSQILSFDKLVATLEAAIDRLESEQADAKALQAETSGEAGKAEQELSNLGKEKKTQIQTNSDTKESCDMDKRDSEEAVRILNEQLAGIQRALEILRPPVEVKATPQNTPDRAPEEAPEASLMDVSDVSAVEQASLFLLAHPEGEVAAAKKAREEKQAEEERSRQNAESAANAFIAKREKQEKIDALAADLRSTTGISIDVSKNGNNADAELADLEQSASLLDQTVESGNNEAEKVEGNEEGEGEVKQSIPLR